MIYKIIFFIFFLVISKLSYSITWPTKNPAYIENKGIKHFIQSTRSGNINSGLYGCVRNNGKRFHEGIDLYGLNYDSNGEVLDLVFSIESGMVCYINDDPSLSDYGKYVVLMHSNKGLKFYSLYAHLAAINEKLLLNKVVKPGFIIGRMGRTAGNHNISKHKAHLHFEIGLKYNNSFQAWYDLNDFKSKNNHSIWNGLNLMGVDPLDFYDSIKYKRADSFLDYIKSLDIFVTVRVYSTIIPNFLKENIVLIDSSHELSNLDTISGWDISFSDFGIPINWKPIYENNTLADDIVLLSYNKDLARNECYSLLDYNGGKVRPSRLLISNIEKLFIK